MLRHYPNSPRSKRNFKSKRKKSGHWWTNARIYSVAEDQQEQITETPSGANSGRMDRGLIAFTLCLIAIGILMVYSSSHLLSSRHYDGYSYRYLQIHIIACTIGLVGMFMTAYVPYRFYAKVRQPPFDSLFCRVIIGFRAEFKCECARGRRWQI